MDFPQLAPGIVPSIALFQRKEIALFQFISSLFEGVGQLLPRRLTGLLMYTPCSSHLGTCAPKK